MDNKINQVIEAIINNPDAISFWINENGPEVATVTHLTEKKESEQKEEITL